jgi:hypothetical protein
MNKILAYTVIAILLGTVTMVAPLALLGPSDSIPEGKFTVTVPEATEPSDQERAYEDGGTLENGNFSTQVTTPEAAPQPSEPAAAPEVSAQEPELTVKTSENPSDLSPIGLMTIPSFLVALGVFVYLRKRVS